MKKREVKPRDPRIHAFTPHPKFHLPPQFIFLRHPSCSVYLYLMSLGLDFIFRCCHLSLDGMFLYSCIFQRKKRARQNISTSSEGFLAPHKLCAFIGWGGDWISFIISYRLCPTPTPTPSSRLWIAAYLLLVCVMGSQT